VLVVHDLGDELIHQPVTSLQTWVESGGRLVIWGNMLESYPALQTWSGIKPAQRQAPSPSSVRPTPHTEPDTDENCALMSVRVDGNSTGQSLRVCNPGSALNFEGDRAPAWSLSDDQGMHVVRTRIGLGEITVLGLSGILTNRILRRADHAELLAMAAGLRHDDTLLILHPARAEPLPGLLWRLAAPAILFLLAATLSLIWRQAPRFGPPVPAAQPVRRSLAEQIRASARFAWRTRNLASLRAAARRSLDEVAERRIAGYAALDAARRAERLQACTGIAADAIGAARADGASGQLNEHRAAITLMEVCRRILLGSNPTHKGLSHDG